MRQNYLRAAAGYRINQSATGPATDQHIANTELLLKGEGSDGQNNNTFLDSSGYAGHTITRYGDTTQGSFSPFSPKGWSGFFDGSNDYLSCGSSSDFAFGTGQFTIEGWFYSTGTQSGSGLFVTSNSFGSSTYQFDANRSEYPNKWGFTAGAHYSNVRVTSTSNIQNNVWTHLAVTRNSSNLVRLFVNGVLEDSSTISNNFSSTGPLKIGVNRGNNKKFKGYISNARLLKGTCLYTSNFTPPTAPLTAVTNTKLLTLQDNRFIDNSASNHSITLNGEPAIKATSPFSGAGLINGARSMYFDGSGDYLTTTNSSNFQLSGDWTVEAWVYVTGGPGMLFSSLTTENVQFLKFDTSNGSIGFYARDYNTGVNYFSNTNSFSANTWFHVACSCSSGTLRLYVNGTQVDTASNFGQTSTRLTVIGAFYYRGSLYTSGPTYFNGFISNLRMVKGTAVYTSNFTPPTAPLQSITNTTLLLNGNNGGVEDSLGKNTLQTGGNAQIDTTVKKFDSGSIQFDGSGDYLKTTGFDFSQKYTIEGWVYRQSHSGYQRIFVQGGSTWDWTTTGLHCTMYFESNTNLLTYEIPNGSNSTYQLKDSSVAAADTWHYVAATCNGTTTSLFLNGSRVATRTNVIPRIGGSEYHFSLGSADGIPNSSGGNYLKGFLDDFRVTIGVARYDPTQTSHTVPTTTHPTV